VTTPVYVDPDFIPQTWIQGANSFGAVGVLGSNDAFDLSIVAGGVEAIRVNNATQAVVVDKTLAINTSITAPSVLKVVGDATVASAVSAQWRSVNSRGSPNSTLTLTGNTNVTSTEGLALVRFGSPTITSAQALTVTNASTLYIDAAPGAAGSTTITNTYAIYVANTVSPSKAFFNGGVWTNLGAAATPPYSWTGVTNYGLYLNGTTITMTHAGVNRITFAGGSAPVLNLIGSSSPTINFNSASGNQIVLQLASTPDVLQLSSGNASSWGQVSYSAGLALSSGSGFHHVYTVPVDTGGQFLWYRYNISASTNVTAGTEVNYTYFNIGQTVTWNTGNIATQRCVRVDAPTYDFAAASTVTYAVTFEPGGNSSGFGGSPRQGTNATLTNSHTMRVIGTTLDTSGNRYGVTVAGTWSDGGNTSTTLARVAALSMAFSGGGGFNYTGATKTGHCYGFYINPTLTSLPTKINGALVLSSAASIQTGNWTAGIILNNVGNEAANYQELQVFATSNRWIIGSTKNGTGTVRTIAIQTAATDAITFDISQNIVLNCPNQGLRINNQTNGAGAQTGTLTNAHSAGNPTFWLPISIAGTVRFAPAWA
jgi:hypothetical protein